MGSQMLHLGTQLLHLGLKHGAVGVSLGKWHTSGVDKAQFLQG